MAKTRQTTDAEVMKVLMPGQDVTLTCGMVARVFPLGFRHLSQFSTGISSILQAVSRTSIPVLRADPSWTKEQAEAAQKAHGEEVTRRVMATVSQLLLSDGLDMVRQCVTLLTPAGKPAAFAIDDVPHWDIPLIVEAFVEESFGTEGKWRPWVQAVERVMQRITGKSTSLKDMMATIGKKLGAGNSSAQAEAPQATVV